MHILPHKFWESLSKRIPKQVQKWWQRNCARNSKNLQNARKIESSRPVLIMNENSYFSSANWLAPSFLFPVSLTQTTLSFAFYFFFDSEVTGTLVIRFYLQSRPAIQGNLVGKSFKEVTLNRKNWYKLVINQPISDALRGWVKKETSGMK